MLYQVIQSKTSCFASSRVLIFGHILLNGHYTFHSDGKVIDLDAIVAGIDLGRQILGGSGVLPQYGFGDWVDPAVGFRLVARASNVCQRTDRTYS